MRNGFHGGRKGTFKPCRCVQMMGRCGRENVITQERSLDGDEIQTVSGQELHSWIFALGWYFFLNLLDCFEFLPK